MTTSNKLETLITVRNIQGDERTFSVFTETDSFSDIMKAVNTFRAEHGLVGWQVFEWKEISSELDVWRKLQAELRAIQKRFGIPNADDKVWLDGEYVCVDCGFHSCTREVATSSWEIFVQLSNYQYGFRWYEAGRMTYVDRADLIATA